MMGEKWW